MKYLSLVTVLFGALVGCSDSSTSNITLKSASSGLAAKIFGASAPSSLKLKIYKFAVSANADCSSPITIYETSSPSYVEFGSSTTIGTGSLDDGDYPCIMFEISDQVKFTPSENAGDQCVAGEEETLEVCRDNGSGAPTYKLIDGTTGTCTSNEDQVGMYISTNSTSTTGGDNTNAFEPPTAANDAAHGLKLNGEFTVSGAATAVFVVQPSGDVATDGDRCDMQPPQFGFTSE